MDIQPAVLSTKSIYTNNSPQRANTGFSLPNLKELKEDTITFTANSPEEEFNGEQIYLYEDINNPDRVISGEDGKQEISIIADLNVKTIRNSYAPIKISNCNIETSFIKNDFKDINIFESTVRARNRINNNSGNIDILDSKINSRSVKNSHGNISIKDSTLNAQVANSWGNTEILSSNNEKCTINGKVSNEWGDITIKGETKDNKVIVNGNVENTSGHVVIKNAVINGTVRTSGDRIHLSNSEIDNLVIDANYDENPGGNLLTRMIHSIANNKSKEQVFVLKKGCKINGDVKFVCGHGQLIVEEGAEFNGRVKGGELIR